MRTEPKLSDVEALKESSRHLRGTDVLLESSGWCTEIGIAAKEMLV